MEILSLEARLLGKFAEGIQGSVVRKADDIRVEIELYVNLKGAVQATLASACCGQVKQKFLARSQHSVIRTREGKESSSLLS